MYYSLSKEEAKQASEILTAWLEGKTIQVKHDNCDWQDCPNCPSNAYVLGKYRVKPEIKYRPYECIEEFATAWVKEHNKSRVADNLSGLTFSIRSISNIGISMEKTFEDGTYKSVGYDQLVNLYTWTDDHTPCGVIVNQ